VSTGDTVMTRN